MRLRFWGTRGSIAKAGTSTVRYGGNTSCVEVRSAAGTLVVLDCGTGATGLGQALSNPEDGPIRGNLLITHTHWDHIQGFPFFTPLYIPGNEWTVHGPRGVGSSLRDALAGQMQYTYFPITIDTLGAVVHYQDLVESTFEIDDIRVTARYLNHPALTLGYRLEVDGVTVVYSTDHEPHSRRLAYGDRGPLGVHDREHARFLAGADLVIHDSQYTAEEYAKRIGWGHSTVESVVETALAAGVKRLALYHHDPMRDDDSIDGLVVAARERTSSSEMEVFAAAEGQEVEFEQSATDEPTVERTRLSPVPSLSSEPRRHSVLVGVPKAEVAETIGNAIEAEGMRLVVAGTADQALEFAREHKLSLIILAHDLPGDVLDVCRQLRAANDADSQEVPIVMVENHEDAEHQRLAAEAGVTDWLVEPFSEAYARTRARAWVLRSECRWKNAPPPGGAKQRSKVLRALNLLDAEPEERFDRFTRIAAALFDVPIALLGFLDEERLHFKSRFGIGVIEAHHDTALCSHTILGDDVLQVADTHRDDRFADSPMVIDGPHARFYAGVPLSAGNGCRVGTLCLMDHRVRQLTEAQVALLRDLGKLVERELAEPSSGDR